MKNIFSNIIMNNVWKKSICGPGSTLEYTENIRKELIPMIRNFNIQSILDLPCGDFSWMSTVNFPSTVSYIGADIVDFMISENKLKYPDKDFRILDLSKDALPAVDLLICRDCLLHLSHSDINLFLKNILNSDIKYILLSNWFEQDDNYRDIETGKVRYINFLKSPYNFPDPLYSITDYIVGYPKREMLLWSREAIKYEEDIK